MLQKTTPKIHSFKVDSHKNKDKLVLLIQEAVDSNGFMENDGTWNKRKKHVQHVDDSLAALAEPQSTSSALILGALLAPPSGCGFAQRSRAAASSVVGETFTHVLLAKAVPVCSVPLREALKNSR